MFWSYGRRHGRRICNAELLMYRQMRRQMHRDMDVELADIGPDVKPPTEP